MTYKLVKIEPLRSWVEVKGIALGRCISGQRLGNIRGHAHNGGFRQGWICIKKREDLGETLPCDGTTFEETLIVASNTAVHEYAHIITPNEPGHGQAWREAAMKLGIPYLKTLYGWDYRMFIRKCAKIRRARKIKNVENRLCYEDWVLLGTLEGKINW
jgi:hypothetical protein